MRACASDELQQLVADQLARHATTAQAEAAIRAALARQGAAALRDFLQAHVDAADAARPTPTGMCREGRRPRWVRSAWGDFQIHRAYYRAAAGGPGWAPADPLMGTWHGYTPALASILGTLAAAMPFAAGAALLQLTTGAWVDPHQVQRFAHDTAPALAAWVHGLRPPAEAPDTLYVSYDGTGVPMRRAGLAGRQGHTPGVPPTTREMRLACLFTQTTTDPQGQARRDPDSTSYVASFAAVAQFGPQVKQEARRRGLRRARRVVVLTDGAAWCETLATSHFPRATRILDFYHAAEHLQQLAKALFAAPAVVEQHFTAWRHALRDGQAPDLVRTARALAAQAVDPEAAQRELAYLERHLPQMRYADFRRAGLFIGSGVVEAGCKTVVGQRTKGSGMHWGEPGAQAVLTLRCALLSNRLDDFWRATFTLPRVA